MKSYIFLVTVAFLSHIYDSEESHGRQKDHNSDVNMSNKEELIQIVKRLNSEERRTEELGHDNDLENLQESLDNPDGMGAVAEDSGGKESRIHYIANPAVLLDYMKQFKNHKSDFEDTQTTMSQNKELSRRNARFRLDSQPSSEIKEDLNIQRNDDDDNLFTRMVAPSIQEQVTPFKQHYQDDKQESSDNRAQNNYNVKAKDQNNHMNDSTSKKYEREYANEYSDKAVINKDHTGKENNKNNRSYGDNDSSWQLKTKDNSEKNWDKKNDWKDSEKKIDWDNSNKNNDWDNSNKRDWNDPEKKRDWGNDWNEKDKKNDWNNNENSFTREKTTKNKWDSQENKHNNNDWKKDNAKNDWDAVGLHNGDSMTRYKKFDRFRITKRNERTSKKSGWKDDVVKNMKRLETQNNEWDKITNSWNQDKESNIGMKKPKQSFNWETSSPIRDIILKQKRTTKGKAAKDNWDQPIPNYENRYKNKMANYYRQNRDKEHGNANVQAFGRTPIPFIGKKGIYADK